ncbi:ubiquitin carboxyl-terminal hydrolase isoform X2 [Hermetia illucens]|uniref:ubiquitin carboxyl-terminal hydrolase isoform X2 n=1 Tax=Hermetia illucens TaxID=343691 RepID=UPI0018CC3174|nr:ubiquitin carboxyl-terminal hydrolase isoform X2 [Hermetia illucens]
MTTWLPMESNPDVMSSYIHKLGVSKDWSLIDVVGLDEELLEWVPKPVKALILLFPCSEAYEKYRDAEDEKLKQNPPKYPDDLFYMKQCVHNACGTIALVHSLANNKDIPIEEGILQNYLKAATSLSPEERGRTLEADEAFTTAHHELAQQGQTAANPDEGANHHFVALINKDGHLFELDGRKSAPVDHGETSEGKFLNDAARVCKEFMERDPDEVRFTVIALVPKQE